MRVTYALRIQPPVTGVSHRLDNLLRTIPLANLQRTARRALEAREEPGLVRTTASISLEASQRLTKVLAATSCPAQRLLRQVLREY